MRRTPGEIRLVYIQHDLDWELPVMTMRTQVPRAKQDTTSRDSGLCSRVTGYLAILPARRFALQQLNQRACSGLMHSRWHGHLDSFQVQLANSAALLKDHAE